MREHREAAGREEIRGVVLGHNLGPRGEVEGVLLRRGEETVQVNFPPGTGEALAPVGGEVALPAEPEPHGQHGAEHPVYRWAGEGRHGAGRPEGPLRVEGVVVRRNFTRHGEANGVVLDTGDFLHFGPGRMRRAAVAVGRRVVAEGKARRMASGGLAVEVESVDGVEGNP